MNRSLVILILLAISGTATGQSLQFMQNENANELFFLALAVDCPIEMSDAEQVVSRAFVKKQITPKLMRTIDPSAVQLGMLFMQAGVQCEDASPTSVLYFIDVRLATIMEHPTAGPTLMYYATDYGGIGITHERGAIAGALRKAVNDFLVDYIGVNFGVANE